MKQLMVGDYICEFLLAKGVTDVFGYQGGMISYLFDSFGKYKEKLHYHIPYNEQGGAFAANAYAQISGKVGFCCATSGPGFVNMISGMANAYFDGIPMIFVCGEVNFKDKLHGLPMRQRGFQETPEPPMAAPVCKKVYDIDYSWQIKGTLKEAYEIANSGHKGPVFIEIPINVFRGMIEVDDNFSTEIVEPKVSNEMFDMVLDGLAKAKKPIIVGGAGITESHARDLFREFVSIYKIPVVTTMPGVDILPDDSTLKYKFIGASGMRLPRYLASQADYVITIGSRLAQRQVGHRPMTFCPKAKLIRFDLDAGEFARQIYDEETDIVADIVDFMKYAIQKSKTYATDHSDWSNRCNATRPYFAKYDHNEGNDLFETITSLLPDDSNIILDVGKIELFGAQSSVVKKDTRILMSAAYASMGYALPASIGAFYANHHPTFSFSGDGGIQMNIQELNTISRNHLPVKTFVINNHSLANITIFQDQTFHSRYVATKEKEGDYYPAPVVRIAEAYGIKAIELKSFEDIGKYNKDLLSDEPILFEVFLPEDLPLLPSIVCGDPVFTSSFSMDSRDVDQIRKLIE